MALFFQENKLTLLLGLSTLLLLGVVTLGFVRMPLPFFIGGIHFLGY